MKHPRKIIKAQTANAVLLSLFTAFSPSQVFGSSFASTDANEYLFKEYVPNHKRIHSAPIEHVLRKELEDFVGKGDYVFFSQETEITWNVWTEGNILGNSVATHGKNLIFKADKGSFVLTPESVSVKGFGSAVQVGYQDSVHISAGEKIILNKPQPGVLDGHKDPYSITLGEGASAFLEAKEIILYGSIGWMGAGSKAELKASESVQILTEKEKHSGLFPLWIFDGALIIDAPTVMINRDILVSNLDEGYETYVHIGLDERKELKTRDVLFGGEITVRAQSTLKAKSSDSMIFDKALLIDGSGKVEIESRNIALKKLNFQQTGGSASFTVLPEGSLKFADAVSVINGARLDITLGERSVLNGAVFTDFQEGKGGSYISLGAGSIWQNAMRSNVTELTVSEGAVIEVGSDKGLRPLEIQSLKGTGAAFYLPGGRAGSIRQSGDAEGVHSVYLGTSGASLTETKLVHHVFSFDDALPSANRSEFVLGNGGLVEAGPFQYKLDIQPVEYEDQRVWLITSEKEEKPIFPVFPPNDSTVPPLDPGETPSIPAPAPEVPEVGLSRSGKTVLSVVGSGAAVVQYLSSLADLQERTGELRRGASDGAYVLGRYEKGRFASYSSVGNRLRYSTVSFGTDKKIDQNWIIGAQLGMTDGNIRVEGDAGKTDIHSFGGKAYLTWFKEDAYVDTVLTFNRHKQKMRANLMEGTTAHAAYHNFGFGISSEGGIRFNFLENANGSAWFIEPQAQLSYYRLLGEDFSFSHGMKVKVNSSDSLNMRVGLAAGRAFNSPDGQRTGSLFVKAGVNHDFLGKTKIRMNEFDFKTRSLGTRFYFGVGGEYAFGNQWKAFAQIGGEHGNRLNVDFSCKAGIKYTF